MTCDTWWESEHFLKISAPQLLRFGIDSVLKILNKRITQLMNHEGVYRTAPATPGLLIIWESIRFPDTFYTLLTILVSLNMI